MLAWHRRPLCPHGSGMGKVLGILLLQIEVVNRQRRDKACTAYRSSDLDLTVAFHHTPPTDKVENGLKIRSASHAAVRATEQRTRNQLGLALELQLSRGLDTVKHGVRNQDRRVVIYAWAFIHALAARCRHGKYCVPWGRRAGR